MRKQTPSLASGETWLSDFATLHRVPTQEAYALWSRGMIRGRKVGQGRYVKIAIGPQGRYEAGYQLKALPDFVSCDECPHSIQPVETIEQPGSTYEEDKA